MDSCLQSCLACLEATSDFTFDFERIDLRHRFFDMNKRGLLLIGLLCAYAFSATAQNTSFTYQGRLLDNGTPANGIYDLRFNLFAAETSGVALGDPFSQLAIPTSNGLFTVALDFGAAVFMGGDRWLEVSVRTNGDAGPYTTLVPRQPITSTPYACRR